MAENKTRPTDARVDELVAAIDDAERRTDAAALTAMMSAVTGEPPVLWGPSIVGFGQYHYRYESGREGDMCVVGFAPKGREISVYLVAEAPAQQALLARLGRHRMGKACLYLRRLADVDAGVLQALVAGSVEEVRRRYPGAAGEVKGGDAKSAKDAKNAKDLKDEKDAESAKGAKRTSAGTARKPAAPGDVDAFLDAAQHPRRAAIDRLRALIRGTDRRIAEEIKWNAPSFRLHDHFATFRLQPPTKLQLVLHTGAKARGPARAFAVDDPARLLAWPAPDRAVMNLPADDAWTALEPAMRRILAQWVAQLDERSAAG